MSDELEIQRLAYKVWDLFYTVMDMEKVSASNRGNFSTHKFSKAFMGIATRCACNNIDIADYLDVCFELTGRDSKYVLPSHFNNDDALMAYKKRKKEWGDRAPLSWAAQIQELVQASFTMVPALYASEEEILDSPDMPFSAWFRVLYPEVASERLMRHYGRIAWSNIQADPLLMKFVKLEMPGKVSKLEERYGTLIASATR